MRNRERIGRAEAATLLGIPVDADPSTVRHAWRMWARIAHPDVGGDPVHFARLEEARRVMMVPLPVVIETPPRATWSQAVRRPERLLPLALAAVITTALALLPTLLTQPARPLVLAVAALPAAVGAAAWSAWATRELLGPRADRGHRIAMLAMTWLPIAAAQQVLAAAAGVSLLSVLPLFALPLAAAVSTVNPGAGLWRPIGSPGP